MDGALHGGRAGDAAADFVGEAAKIFLHGGRAEDEGQDFCSDFGAGGGSVGGAGGCGCRSLSAMERVVFGCGIRLADLGEGLGCESEGENNY